MRACERVERLGMWVGREEDDRIRKGGDTKGGAYSHGGVMEHLYNLSFFLFRSFASNGDTHKLSLSLSPYSTSLSP